MFTKLQAISSKCDRDDATLVLHQTQEGLL